MKIKINKQKTNLYIIFLILILSLIIAGCSKEDEQKNNGDDNMKNPVVVLETTKGIIEVELNAKQAPISTQNFLAYVKAGHYDGTIFHRVIPKFMVQGGGFLPNGTQKETMAPIKLESRNNLSNDRGTIAMARTTIPDSATSQFFINTVDNDFLNYGPRSDGYAVFGNVTSGMNVVDEIEKVRTTTKARNENWPVEDIVIIKAYVKE